MSKEQTPIEMAIEALELCAEVLPYARTDNEGKWNDEVRSVIGKQNAALAALRAMPAQPATQEVEPVAWMHKTMSGGWGVSFSRVRGTCEPLYTHPPKPAKPRVELADEEIQRMVILADSDAFMRDDGVLMMSAFGNGYCAGLRYARDNGYLAPVQPFPVDAVMDLIEECGVVEKDEKGWSSKPTGWLLIHPHDLRASLTTKFTTAVNEPPTP